MSSQQRLEVLLGHLRAGSGQRGSAASPSQCAGSSHHYRYTVDGCPSLSREQRDFYEENGYLVIPGLVRPELLEVYGTRFQQICSGEAKRAPGMQVMRDVSHVKEGGSESEMTVNKIQGWQVWAFLCVNDSLLHVDMGVATYKLYAIFIIYNKHTGT